MAKNSPSRKQVTRNWSLAAKLAYYTDFSGSCHIFSGTKVRGYGSLRTKDGMRGAHCLAWEEAHGPVPKGLHVLHNCPGGDNPACINPDHLWLGNHAENIADMIAKGRQATGEKKWSAKLTAAQVAAIRVDPRSRRTIADAYGVIVPTIGRIKRGVGWRHVL